MEMVHRNQVAVNQQPITFRVFFFSFKEDNFISPISMAIQLFSL